MNVAPKLEGTANGLGWWISHSQDFGAEGQLVVYGFGDGSFARIRFRAGTYTPENVALTARTLAEDRSLRHFRAV